SDGGEVIGQLLDARLMAHRRPRIGGASRRLSGILAAFAMHLVEILGLRVVGLEIAVGDGPCWRDPATMVNFAEVALAQAKQRRPVKLGVAAHVVVGVRMKVVTVLVEPRLFGVVVGVDIYNLGVPVGLFALNIVAALQDEDALARRREMIRQGASAGACADDDYVVAVVV